MAIPGGYQYDRPEADMNYRSTHQIGCSAELTRQGALRRGSAQGNNALRGVMERRGGTCNESSGF